MRDAETHDVLGRQRVDRAAAEADVALAADHGAERAQDRRLAGAVGAEQRGHAAVLDLEIEPVQRLRRAVEGLEALGLQDRRAQRALPR